MCGLVAALLGRPRLDEERVAAALHRLAHRGPDGTAWWFSADRRMVLGHVRLAVVGLDNGTQPLSNGAGDVHCVVNGELYGYRGIRAELQARGQPFTTDSDSEIALRLYERLGSDAVHRLRGEFAVVIADERRRCLIAVRDRFGVKPLHYAVVGGDVFVASEVKALLALGVPARWDRNAFFAELHGVRTADRTLFEGIRSVPPGCWLLAQDGRVEIRRYWDLDFPSAAELRADDRPDSDVVAGFREVLDDAIGERLVADVEVASYLSGGIDSSAVLGLAQRRTARPIRAFSISFPDARYDEVAPAERTARWLGSTFVPVPIMQSDLAEAFADAVWHAETVVFNAHGVAKYLLSRAVRDAGIKVVFTGEGADEILAGYPPFRRDMLLHDAGDQPPDDLDRLLAELAEGNRASRGLLSAEGAPAPGLDVVEARLGWVPSALSAWSAAAGTLLPLLRPGYRQSLAGADPYAELLDVLDGQGRLAGRNPVNQALYLWARTHLPTYVLTFLGDRSEMAHSVEGRVPFLDHRVAEYAARLPVRHKIRGMREKHVLREAVRDCVLPEVYDRHKHPFVAPPPRGSGDPLAVFCDDVLRSAAVEAQPFFDPARVRSLADQAARLPADERAVLDGIVLRVVSTCLLQERFRLGT